MMAETPKIDWSVDIPIGDLTLQKSESGVMEMDVLLTTGNKDEQKEQLLQNGLNWDYFKVSGVVNDNHDKSTASVIGVPLPDTLRYGEYTKKNGEVKWGWICRIRLFDSDLARKIWQVAENLEKFGRVLGCSVEGSYGERDPENPNIVRSAIIRHVALTASPVNPEAEARISAVKSFACLNDLMKSITSNYSGGTSAQGVMGVVPESLDAETHDETYGSPARKKRKKKKKRKGQLLSKKQAIEYIITKGLDLSRADAKLILSFFN